MLGPFMTRHVAPTAAKLAGSYAALSAMTVPAVLCMLTGGLPQQVPLPDCEDLLSLELLEQWLCAGYLVFLEPGIEELDELDEAHRQSAPLPTAQNVAHDTISEEADEGAQAADPRASTMEPPEASAGRPELRVRPPSTKRLRAISVARDRGMSVARSRGASMLLWSKPPVQWHAIHGISSRLEPDELRPISESGASADWADSAANGGPAALDNAASAGAAITGVTSFFVRSIAMAEASGRARPRASSISHVAASSAVVQGTPLAIARDQISLAGGGDTLLLSSLSVAPTVMLQAPRER